MSWKEKLSFISPSFIEHQIQGETLHFYPISLKHAFAIRSVAQPIAKALTIILTKHDGDQAQQAKSKFKAGQIEDQDIKVEAISKDLASLRTTERANAVSDAINTLLDPENAMIFGILLVDSLRDIFPRDTSRADARNFVEGLGLDVATEFLIGLALANKKVLGPFAEMAGEAMKRSLAGLRGEAPLPEPEPPSETIG